MGLLARCRRSWIVAFIGLLWLPILGQVLLPSRSVSEAEARRLQTLPPLPTSRTALAAFPKQLDSYLADQFGFRSQLIHANALLRYALSSPTNRWVLYGKDGYLFYLEHGTLEQSVGLVIRQAALERMADMLAQLHDQLSRRNIRFLFTAPPSNSTINIDRLPDWLPTKPAVTEYDVLLRLLAARGVPALDLRPALRAENSRRPTYYKTDTHWNFLGALVARNEIVRAIGHPEWALDVERVFVGMRRTYGVADLARYLGLPNDVPEDQYAVVDVSSYPSAEGPTVLLLGDSFTVKLMPMIWRNGGKPVFMEYPGCRLDIEAIAAHRPAFVILSITERALGLLC